MYTITCDGLPILDLRDDDYIVDSPRVKMEVNTVGEGSFKIFKTHPHYESMKKLKSVFEVRDDYGVIFRGRMTDSTTDFNNGKNVDLEGVMAYFNDSLIKPFGFPADFLDNAAYNTAAKSGNVVEFLLGWIIEQHNNQVQPFQQFKLGRVTVKDPNNYLYRRREAGHITSWEALKTRLFDSALGGYLCIRYEADGNYIDYLEDFEEVNTQEIVFGENLLDFLLEEDATATYTAMVPYGAELEAETEEEEGERPHLTIESLPDGNITEDIVKSGDTLYSKSGVERFGWIYAPISETTWDDVTVAENLQNKGVARLEKTAVFLKNTIELSAADLHYTDDQIMSFRIYKKVKVVSKPHGLSELYRLTELEIPLMEPQNMKITVGETRKTLLSMQKDEQYFTQQNMQVITEKVATVDKATREAVEKLKVTDETLVNWCHDTDKTLIDGAKIYSGSIFAEQIAAHTLTSEQIDVESLFSQRIEADNLDVVAGELQLSTDRLTGKDSYIDLFALDNGGEFDFKMTPHAITSWRKGTASQGHYDGYSIVTSDKFEIKDCEPDGTMTSAASMDSMGVHAGNADLTGAGLEIRDNVGRKFTVGVNGLGLQMADANGANAMIWMDYAADAGGYQMSLNAQDILFGGNLYRQGNQVFDTSMTIPATNGGTGFTERWRTHSFTVNEEAATELATPLVRYYPYLGLAFIRIAVKTTGSTSAGGTLKLGTLSCQPSYMQPVSGYATKELDAYVSYSDSSVNIRAREAIGSGYEIRINGWITIQ